MQTEHDTIVVEHTVAVKHIFYESFLIIEWLQ